MGESLKLMVRHYQHSCNHHKDKSFRYRQKNLSFSKDSYHKQEHCRQGQRPYKIKNSKGPKLWFLLMLKHHVLHFSLSMVHVWYLMLLLWYLNCPMQRISPFFFFSSLYDKRVSEWFRGYSPQYMFGHLLLFFLHEKQQVPLVSRWWFRVEPILMNPSMNRLVPQRQHRHLYLIDLPKNLIPNSPLLLRARYREMSLYLI